MRTRSLLALALAGAFALPVLAAPLEELLKQADHESLGKKIAKYFDAKQANAGIDKDTRENALIVAVTMPEDGKQWLEAGSREQPGGFANMMLTMREVRAKYAIDYDRIFIAGRGEGVAAALAIAGRAPDRFAGVLGRAGDLDAAGPGIDNFKNLPTFFGGAGANATAYGEKCTN